MSTRHEPNLGVCSETERIALLDFSKYRQLATDTFVCSQIDSLWEAFAAYVTNMTTIGRMTFLVVAQRGRTEEASVTEFTSKRLFAGVNALVVAQRIRTTETFVAELANIWPIARMDALMTLQVGTL